MKIGASVWILLSEKLLFLGGNRKKDPFYELYSYEYLDMAKNF